MVAAVADGPSLVAAALEHRRTLSIADVRMPPTNTDEGLRASLQIRRSWPDAAVMVLSQYVEVSYFDDLTSTGDGGLGYLLKDRVSEIDDFLSASRDGRLGWKRPRPARREAAHAPTPRPDRDARPAGEVLALMAEGHSNAKVAETLVVRRAPSAHPADLREARALRRRRRPPSRDGRRVLPALRQVAAAPLSVSRVSGIDSTPTVRERIASPFRTRCARHSTVVVALAAIGCPSSTPAADAQAAVSSSSASWSSRAATRLLR